MKRPRFTLRWTMVAVAIAGLACGAKVNMDRSAVFAKRAAAWSWTEITEARGRRRPGMREHFQRLADKYERAARYPWLTVSPDPPEPR